MARHRTLISLYSLTVALLAASYTFLQTALALLWERRDECPGAVPVLAVHDEIVVECDEGEAEKVEAWLKNAMVDGMDTVVNATEPNVPIEVETSVAQTWG